MVSNSSRSLTLSDLSSSVDCEMRGYANQRILGTGDRKHDWLRDFVRVLFWCGWMRLLIFWSHSVVAATTAMNACHLVGTLMEFFPSFSSVDSSNVNNNWCRHSMSRQSCIDFFVGTHLFLKLLVLSNDCDRRYVPYHAKFFQNCAEKQWNSLKSFSQCSCFWSRCFQAQARYSFFFLLVFCFFLCFFSVFCPFDSFSQQNWVEMLLC